MNAHARHPLAPAAIGAILAITVALTVGACGGPAVAPPASFALPRTTELPVESPVTAPRSSAPRPGGTAGSPTGAEIERLRAAIAADPRDVVARRDLGFALVQRVRETADPSLYEPAIAAFDAALTLQPEDPTALVGRAAVQLGRHEFEAALATARRAVERSPSLVAGHAAIVDALIELGRYDEADEAAGIMLGLRVDLTTLARVSYLAELRGRLPAAVAAMRLAAASSGLPPENAAYVTALLGNLLVYSGKPDAAEAAYRDALALVPDHPASLAGLGRLAVGSGRLDDAIRYFEQASAIVPLPEYVVALGETQAAAGRTADAQRSEELARAEIQLFRSAGVGIDVELALFEADHGDPAAALRHARLAHAAAPTVRAADAVAWALHRLGRDAEAAMFSAEALRLGSIDPVVHYHAGAIAVAVGDAAAARRHLALALATDPGFSATGAADARRLLDSLR